MMRFRPLPIRGLLLKPAWPILDGMRRETEQYARGLARGQSTVEDQARLLSFIQEQDRDLRRQMRELEGRRPATFSARSTS